MLINTAGTKNQEPRFPEKSWDESHFPVDGGMLIKTVPVLDKIPGTKNQEPRFPKKSWDESWFLRDGGVLIKTGPVLIKTPGTKNQEPRTKIPRKVLG